MPWRVTAVSIPEDFTDDGRWLVQAIDPRARLARLVALDREAIRAASFLDDRLMANRPESRLCSLGDVIEQGAEVRSPAASWIFHIGHVGSTLVSRLLGELDGVIALREPRSLRDLAVAAHEERRVLAESLRRLMARRTSSDRAVIVKATSFVSEFAPLLVEPGAAALFLYATPANYIAGVLAGENSVKELAALGSLRADRLTGRGISLSDFDKNDAHRAAAAWACEMTSLEAAADALPESSIMWADFDQMLDDMPTWLARAAGHFGIEAPPDEIHALAKGPLMRRYSKALEYDYSPSLRADLLAEAKRDHLTAINAALAALSDAASSAHLLERALRRAEGEI